jgi:hypothetical protein
VADSDKAFAIVWDDPRRAAPGSGASYVLHAGACRDVQRAQNRNGSRSVTYFPSVDQARELMISNTLGDLDDAPCIPRPLRR